MLTWPFLNLWFLEPRERLSVSDVLFLAFSILIGSALFTLLLLDAYAYWGLAAKMDQQLEKFANNIQENFHKELDQIHQQLSAMSDDALYRLNAQPQEYRDKSKNGHSSENQSPETTEMDEDSVGSPLNLSFNLSFQVTNLLSNDRPYDLNLSRAGQVVKDAATFWIPPQSYADSIYPYFDSVFWVDSEGWQRSKWTVQSQTTLLTNVYARDYSRSILEGWSWTRQRDGKTVHFYVEPLYSWNTGENLTVYSIPVKEPSHSSLLWPSASDHGSVKLAVAALATQLLSLTQPVVPPGFGYAVIKDDGTVLFHVDNRRNLRENFFAESHPNKLLRSAVFGHFAEWIDTQYGGKPHRLYVRPIDALPWFLVVYRDKALLRTANLELLSVAMTLIIFYFSILLVLLLLYLLISGDRLRWLWPTPKQTSAYWLLGMINSLLCLVFYVGVGYVTDRLNLLLAVTVVGPVLEVLSSTPFWEES